MILDRNNRFLFCSYKMAGECINMFHQRKIKPNMSKISVTSDNNVFFLVIIFIIFTVFNRKRREHRKLCYLAIFLVVILLLKFQIKDGLPASFTSLQKCSTNDFFNLGTITSCHYIQHITLFFLTIANLKYKVYDSFDQFPLLLSGDVSLNLEPVQISPAVNVNIWEPLNKKRFSYSSNCYKQFTPKIDELKSIDNKVKTAVIGITEAKLCHSVSGLEVNLPGYDILQCDIEIEMVVVLPVI